MSSSHNWVNFQQHILNTLAGFSTTGYWIQRPHFLSPSLYCSVWCQFFSRVLRHLSRVPPLLLFPWCPFLSRLLGIWQRLLNSFSSFHVPIFSRIFGIWQQHLLSFLPLPIVPILWPDFPYLATASLLLLSSPFCGRNFVIWQRCLHSFSNFPREPNLPILLPNLDTLPPSQTAYIESELCGEH